MRNAETLTGNAVHEAALQLFPGCEADGVNQDVDPIPVLAERRKQLRDLPVVRDIAGQHD